MTTYTNEQLIELANTALKPEVGQDGCLTGYDILEMEIPARLCKKLDTEGDIVGMKLMETGHGYFSLCNNGSWEFMGKRFPNLMDAVKAARALKAQ